ncbi:MAG: tetratricopeptide repeat protein [Polyangiales bacterium]
MLNVRGFVGIVAAMAATVGTTVASAQTPEVERLLRHGIELRQQGNNAEALAEFQRADQLANTPRTLAQMALAEQALGRWLNAETHLREALRSADDPWITRNRAALDGALGVITQHVGQVIVSCDTNGAELTIGGRSAGLLPLVAPLRVEAGEVEVVARAEGRSASQRVHINAGETAQVVLHIGQVRTARSPSVRAPIAHADLPRATPETNQPGSAQRAFGWVSTVTGVLSLGVGVGGIVLREGAARSYNDDSRCPGENAPTSQGPTCQGYLDDVSLGNTLQLAGMIGGGALSLTGIILLATAPSGVSRATASVRCGVGPGTVGLICGGTF